MVDIKREDITLQDWTKGISADEFAGGSYFYSEAISSGYNTKGFELGYRISKRAINNRANGQAVSLAPTLDYGFMAITKDGMIETEDFYNGSSTGTGDDSIGGAIFSRYGWAYSEYINGISYGDTAIGIGERYIDTVNITSAYDPADELLTEPKFDNAGAAWTIGTGWTITDEGAEHTAGNTGTLSATINFDTTPTSSDYVRVALKLKNNTKGHLTVALDAPTTEYDTPNSTDGWMVLSFRCSSSSTSLIITPTSNFEGTIEAVNVHLYDSSSVKTQRVNLYNGDFNQPHPALVWEGDLYVACGHYVNIISLVDRGRTYKALVDKNFTIVSMTQQAGNIILWATDGFDSRQYYWNGVDAVASEVIEWKGLIIKGVTGTETISYVLTTSGKNVGSIEGYEYRLYAVSGYQRSLIASKLYQYKSGNYLESAHYNENKKFDFNDVATDQSMTIFLDSLYIPGCDGVYKYGYDIPGLRTAWTRPIKYDVGATNIIMGQRGHYLGVAFTSSGVNYVANVDNRLYPSTGFLVTDSIYRDRLSTRKSIEKMKIGYKNVASSVGNIKLYAIVDDTYFWRFRPTVTPTKRPSVGDVYNVANNTTAKVINVDTDEGVITFATLENNGSYAGLANTALTKVSGGGDDTITVGYNYDNMCLLKTIESETQGYGSDLIFGKNFVNNHMPYWYKIQFVIELNSNDSFLSPEVFEISLHSDIDDVVL